MVASQIDANAGSRAPIDGASPEQALGIGVDAGRPKLGER